MMSVYKHFTATTLLTEKIYVKKILNVYSLRKSNHTTKHCSYLVLLIRTKKTFNSVSETMMVLIHHILKYNGPLLLLCHYGASFNKIISMSNVLSNDL